MGLGSELRTFSPECAETLEGGRGNAPTSSTRKSPGSKREHYVPSGSGLAWLFMRLIGSSPVNSIETPHPDAANAVATMKRISRRVQRKGWWCNIDYNLILTPDSAGEIRVSGQISSLVAENPNYILRGARLYDKVKQTTTFCENVSIARVTRILEWDEMPDVMQEYCAYYAGAEFIRDELEDPQKESSLSQSASASLLDLRKQELEEGQYNIFKTPRIAQARSGIQPYRRSNTRFYGDPDA